MRLPSWQLLQRSLRLEFGVPLHKSSPGKRFRTVGNPMTDRSSMDKLDPASRAWQAAMDQGKFKDALKAGYQAWFQCETDGDEHGSMAALGLIHLAIAELIFGNRKEGAAAAPSCSFCGRSGSQVRLGAGPDVFICADCVGIFHQAFAPGSNGRPS